MYLDLWIVAFSIWIKFKKFRIDIYMASNNQSLVLQWHVIFKLSNYFYKYKDIFSIFSNKTLQKLLFWCFRSKGWVEIVVFFGRPFLNKIMQNHHSGSERYACNTSEKGLLKWVSKFVDYTLNAFSLLWSYCLHTVTEDEFGTLTK